MLLRARPLLTLLPLLAAACSDDDDDAAADRGSEQSATESERYALASLVTDSESNSNGYLKILPSLDLDGTKVDLETAREFPGQSDVWVWGKSVYVSSGDEPSITKYDLGADGELEEGDQVNFSSYGIASSAFWNNTFVSATKAYMANGADELIVWNPSTMEIEGTLEITGLENKGNLMPRAALADRSNVVHDGKVYRPIYWTNEDYSGRSEESVIAVIDGKTDEVIEQITVPCTGLDYGTVTDDGKLFFSTWTGSVGTRLKLDTPPTCFAEIDPDSNTVVATTTFAEATGGHEGAAMKYVGDGRFVFSVFEEDQADAGAAGTPGELVSMPAWRLWSYDPEAEEASPIEGIDWNSGAIYHARIDDQVYSLVPGADYAHTTVYALTDGKAEKAYEMNGWSIRLFAVE